MSDLEMKYFEMLLNLIDDLQGYLRRYEAIINDEEATKNLLESMQRFLYAFRIFSRTTIEEASSFLPK